MGNGEWGLEIGEIVEWKNGGLEIGGLVNWRNGECGYIDKSSVEAEISKIKTAIRVLNGYIKYLKTRKDSEQTPKKRKTHNHQISNQSTNPPFNQSPINHSTNPPINQSPINQQRRLL